MNTITQFGYSPDEKREVIEHLIEERRWARNSDEPAQCAIYNVLRSIAADYRARDARKIGEVLKQIEKALDHAYFNKKPTNYEHVTHLVSGAWPMIRQALEEFERHV